jgi:hypothetical protein
MIGSFLLNLNLPDGQSTIGLCTSNGDHKHTTHTCHTYWPSFYMLPPADTETVRNAEVTPTKRKENTVCTNANYGHKWTAELYTYLLTYCFIQRRRKYK